MRFNFIDICYPDNLTDHHNRDGEQLISVVWSTDLTDHQLVEAFCDEALAVDNDDFWGQLPLDDETCRVKLYQSIADEILGIDLSMPDVDCPEEIMIYGYFSW